MLLPTLLEDLMLQQIIFELVVECRITAAAMNYFGIQSPDDPPMKNKVPTSILNKDKWKALRRVVSNIVDQYVITHEIDQVSEYHPLQPSAEYNLHQA